MVTTERLDLGPSVGSFWWNGATGVTWTVDPHEDLIYLNFIQHSGTPPAYAGDYIQAVYQAIVD
jgi:CubicO group peptidase (beta-lactamase class C family)